MTSRLDRLREALAEQGFEAILVSNINNCRYLSGFTGSTAWLPITISSAAIAVDSRYVEQAKRECPAFDLQMIRGDLADWFPSFAASSGISKWAIEAQSISLAAYQSLTMRLAREQSQLQLVPASNLIERLRQVKEPGELDLIREACRLADLAFEHARHLIRPGLSELALSWELEKTMRENGSEPMPFELIVASGPNAALPHARASARKIEPGDPVTLDFGARFGGYCSDFTRTVCCGEPDDMFRRVYTAVLGGQEAAMALLRPGMMGEQVDQLARSVISAAGYGEMFGHGLGHGVGLDVHELPRIGARSQDVIQEGMVFTIEPGVYVPGWGGVRIEDTILVESRGARPLTLASKSLAAANVAL